jgi:hypothetical protein
MDTLLSYGYADGTKMAQLAREIGTIQENQDSVSLSIPHLSSLLGS